MLCSICGKNPATIHIQEITGSEKKILHLCQECAEKRASEDAGFQEFNLAEVLFQLSSKLGDHLQRKSSEEEPAEAVRKIECKTCGWTSEAFQKNGKLGCPDCYKAFREILDQSLDSLHRGTTHTGKHPLPAGTAAEARPKPSVSLLHMNLKHLQVELEDAISAERYEDAAVLRDKISALKQELEELQNEK
ncbi:MAG: UvrB/UvrC motif-containing protein [Lentisphaeria bacterium]|nr:UvrB/UvrC motif-containing protein [Lentisphaeria bacterium]